MHSGLACSALALLVAAPAASAAPLWMRRSEAQLQVNGEECLARAYRALRSEGFTAAQSLENGAWGGKGNRWTLIVCSDAPGGRTGVNFVSSAPAAEGTLHQADHDRLVQRMGVPPAAISSATQSGEPASRLLTVRVGSAGNAALAWPRGAAPETSWVSVVPVGTPDRAHAGRWVYTRNAGGESYDSGPLAPGDYEARLYADIGFGNIVDRVRFKVEGAVRVLDVKLAGRTAIVSWANAPAEATAWVSVVRAGTPDNQFAGPWTYTFGHPTGTLRTPPLAVGNHEARFYGNNGNVVERSPFSVR